MSQVYGDSVQIIYNPTITSGVAYSAGDEVGGVQTLASAGYGGRPRGGVILQHVAVVDKDSNNVGMDILFFSEHVETGGDGSAVSVSDSDLANYCVGAVSISSTSYYNLNSNSIVNQENIGLYIAPNQSSVVYALPVLKSAATYSASGLVFKYSFFRDK